MSGTLITNTERINRHDDLSTIDRSRLVWLIETAFGGHLREDYMEYIENNIEAIYLSELIMPLLSLPMWVVFLILASLLSPKNIKWLAWVPVSLRTSNTTSLRWCGAHVVTIPSTAGISNARKVPLQKANGLSSGMVSRTSMRLNVSLTKSCCYP